MRPPRAANLHWTQGGPSTPLQRTRAAQQAPARRRRCKAGARAPARPPPAASMAFVDASQSALMLCRSNMATIQEQAYQAVDAIRRSLQDKRAAEEKLAGQLSAEEQQAQSKIIADADAAVTANCNQLIGLFAQLAGRSILQPALRGRWCVRGNMDRLCRRCQAPPCMCARHVCPGAHHQSHCHLPHLLCRRRGGEPGCVRRRV